MRTGWLCWRRSLIPFHRGAFVAWGLSNGTFTVAALAAKAKAAGYAWLALELDDYSNHERWAGFRAACLHEDVKPGIWTTEGGNLFMAPDDTMFVIGECEGPADYQGLLTVCAQLSELPPVPRAIVTNFAPFVGTDGRDDPARAKPLIDAGFHCLTEAYMGDNVNATPDRLDFRARQLGWPGSQPVFGVYNAPPSTYDPWRTWPGSSDYLAESVL